MIRKRKTLLLLWFLSSLALADGATEFCLEGEFDLGARYQGTKPEAGEFYPTIWCVVTEDDSSRVMFSGTGKSNPDLDGDWSVAYLPPDLVRIVNRESPPDIEFRPTHNLDEALRVRRIDPRRLVEELESNKNTLGDVSVRVRKNRVMSLMTAAELPLRGRVAVEWKWNWRNAERPALQIMLGDDVLFTATGRWREISDEKAALLWQATPGADPVQVAGDRWPARMSMQLINLTDDVYLVRGVRTGFQHMVVETGGELVVAGAPAGWVEFHHIPPSDLVPGLGVSGLSERFIDFLDQEFPGRPINAVALTHFHDDHAGGARAFAAAGATVYATEESRGFLVKALNSPEMPIDRLTQRRGAVFVSPVRDSHIIGSESNRIKLMNMGPGPHAYAMLGVWAMDRGYFFVSDVHVPNSDADIPRENRVTTECWFARWAVNNLPAEVRVVNSHSAPVTPVSRLKKYLDSDHCQRLSN